jgi:SP family arabinose:H+ symporter-like MFS transporter
MKLYKLSLIVALAGFLFGFDTVVISGAEQQLQALWKTSDFMHGFLVTSMALWGTVLGSIFGNKPCDKYGRKTTLIWIGVLYFVSAFGSALAFDPYSFAIFRFIGGIGVGVSTIAAPAYVSEISSPNNRGRLVALYQFNIVFGILMAFMSNYLLRDFGSQPWRWMVGVEAIPAFIYTVLIFFIPRSPRWLLVNRTNDTHANDIMESISGIRFTSKEIKEIKEEAETDNKNVNIFSNKYRTSVILVFLIAFFNQFSGINAILYYAPRIFELAGLGVQTSLLSSIGIGVVNLIFTLLGLVFIDKIGRKKLMLIGSIGYIISLSTVAYAFIFELSGLIIPIFLFVFIASHAIGQGAVIWVFIAEIFPNKIRAKGQAFGSSTHWVLAAIITFLMPPLLNTFSNPGYVFVFFALMMVLQLLYVLFMMPETKGVPLEEIYKKLYKKDDVMSFKTKIINQTNNN